MRQRVVATTRQRNTAFRQYAISAMDHCDNAAYGNAACKHPHPTHSAYSTAPAPIHRRNSRAAHTHSHIVHTHSRMPPYHMGHAHSHMVPHHMSHAHSHILPYRMDQTAHPPGSTGRGYMSPCRMDRTCPCQKMSQWDLTATIRALYVRKRQNGACFPFALNRNHNKRIKKAQVKALSSRP